MRLGNGLLGVDHNRCRAFVRMAWRLEYDDPTGALGVTVDHPPVNFMAQADLGNPGIYRITHYEYKIFARRGP